MQMLSTVVAMEPSRHPASLEGMRDPGRARTLSQFVMKAHHRKGRDVWSTGMRGFMRCPRAARCHYSAAGDIRGRRKPTHSEGGLCEGCRGSPHT